MKKTMLCLICGCGAPVFVSGGSVFKTPERCFSEIEEL